MSGCSFSQNVSKNSGKPALSILEDQNFAAVMNTVLDGLIVIDSQGVIQAFNPSAARIFGYKHEEVIGKNVNMLMPETYAKEHDDYLKNYIQTHDAKVIGIGREVTGLRKNGEHFPMELGVNEMHLGDKLMFVGTVRDMSQRKAHEQEIQKYIHTLKISNQELDEFAYIASHDLNEPLRGLGNQATFLKEDFGNKLDEDGVKRLDRMIFLCEKMERIISDLLYYSRLGHQEFAFKETDMKDIVTDIKMMIETYGDAQHIDIIVKGQMPIIDCDAVRVKEVFRNLVSNAIKYNPNVQKKVEIGHVENPQGSEQGKHVFYVKDNGIGIPKEFHNTIFRVFKRLQVQDRDENTSGTGVGLTFVKKIVERHGGKIWLESNPEEGATFYFSLEKGSDVKTKFVLAN